jgi:predicted permease
MITGMDSFDRVFRDVQYASRSMRRGPGLATAAILTLALGMGANTAIFSVLEGVVLAPLPYPQPDRLVVLALYNRTLGYPTDLSYPDFLDWKANSRSFQEIAAFAPQGFDLTSPGDPEHVDGKEVSSNFFETLDVKLALGRELTAAEDRPGEARAVIISDRLWRDRFGGNPAALGRNLTLNGVGYMIAGVLRPGFRFGNQQADVYTPIGRRNQLYMKDRTVHDILCVARLRQEVNIGAARAEMNTVQEQIDELNPATERGQGAYVAPLKQFLIGDIGGTLVLLLGAVGMVLLIACGNVAILLLSRSAARTREFAIRLALGASRARIVRQLVAESVVLSLVGGTLGLAIAKWGVQAVLAATQGNIPRIENIGLNTPVLLFAFAISSSVGIAFGLIPALKGSHTDMQAELKSGGRGSAGGHQRTQRVLVTVQIAMALVLLTAGSLLFRTIQNLWAANPGFDPNNVLVFQVGLSPAVNTPAKVRIAYQEMAEHIRQIPDVEAADITALVPLGQGANEGPFWVGPQQPASMAEIPRAVYYPGGPDYVSTMKIPLLRGRFLTRGDNVDSDVVVLIDDLLARRFFPDQEALDRTITIPHWGATRNIAARVVGVVGHVEHYGLDGSMGEKPQIYYSLYQLPDEALSVFRSEVTVAARTRPGPATVMPAIRTAVRQAGTDQPVYNIRTMHELVSDSMGRQRFPMVLLGAFAVLALLLASVGIYGVISYATLRRVNEIGIRMALGAAKWDVLRMVVADGLRLALTGVAAGTVAALALTRLVSSFSHLLYGVRPADPAILAGVSLLLIAVALLACYLPARRAAMLEPTAALRQE